MRSWCYSDWSSLLVSLVVGFRWLGAWHLRQRALQELWNVQGVAAGDHRPRNRRRGRDVAARRDLDLRRIRKLISTDDIVGRVMALDQGRCTCFSPVTTVGHVGLLDRVSGPDSGKAHINWQTRHQPPPSVAFKGRKNARLYWVS